MVTEQTEDENKLNSPWINAGKKKEPDLLIRKDNVDVILDAKYYDSVEKVLSSSSYQFLGYALLPWTNPPNIARSRRLMFAIPQRLKMEQNKFLQGIPIHWRILYWLCRGTTTTCQIS